MVHHFNNVFRIFDFLVDGFSLFHDIHKYHSAVFDLQTESQTGTDVFLVTFSQLNTTFI